MLLDEHTLPQTLSPTVVLNKNTSSGALRNALPSCHRNSSRLHFDLGHDLQEENESDGEEENMEICVVDENGMESDVGIFHEKHNGAELRDNGAETRKTDGQSESTVLEPGEIPSSLRRTEQIYLCEYEYGRCLFSII